MMKLAVFSCICQASGHFCSDPIYPEHIDIKIIGVFCASSLIGLSIIRFHAHKRNVLIGKEAVHITGEDQYLIDAGISITSAHVNIQISTRIPDDIGHDDIFASGKMNLYIVFGPVSPTAFLSSSE